MHMNEFLNLMRSASDAAVAGELKVKFGYVTAYNPATYAVRVRLEPESFANEELNAPGGVVETNWIPLYRSFGGNGWGAVVPPKASPAPPYGDMCIVLWPDGGQGVALCGIYNDVERVQQPTTSYPSADAVGATGATPVWGEIWWTGPTGNTIRILNNGSVSVKGKTGSRLDIDFNGTAACQIISSDGGRLDVNHLGNSSCQLLSSNGAIVLIDSGGNIALAGTGSFVEVGIGTPGHADTGVVTKRDLQTAINNFATANSLTSITVTASATVFATH